MKICLLNHRINGVQIKIRLYSFNFIFLWLSIILFPYSYLNSQSQELTFEHLSVDQGMPTVTNCILQDKTGYLWFATNSGLYKYDGYNFTSYKHDIDDSTSIIDNRLFVLYEDKKGVLWVGSMLGLEKFDRTLNTFIHYTPNPSGIGKDVSNHVYTICEDKYGLLWIGTEDGLYKFNKATEKFISLRYHSTDPGSISHNNFGAIYEDKEGSLWFGTGAGLDKYDFETGKFKHYLNDPHNHYVKWENSSSEYWVNTIIEDENGILWLGTNGGLVEFNPKVGTSSNYLYNPTNKYNRITSICQDVVTGSLWITNGIGLFLFDKKLKNFTQYSSEGNCVLSERSGTLWVGTDIEIKKLNRIKQPFKKYPTEYVSYVIKAGKEGIIWILSSEVGYRKFDTRKEKFVPYSFGKDSVLFVFNSGGDILIYSKKGILYILDSLDIKHILGPKSIEQISNGVFCWKGSKGYWFGTDIGELLFFDPKTERSREMKNLKLYIDFIYENNSGQLWVATDLGKVYCYDLPAGWAGQTNDTLIELISDTKNPLRLSGTKTNEIYEDKKGRVWFATNDGLDRYELGTKNLVYFTVKDGLPGNNLRGILEDDHGYLWITTTKGISKFNPETNQFKNYDVSYGLELTADAFFGKGCKTSNGEMYFGGARGFTRFHPDSVKDNPFIPPIVITSFKKFDKPYPFINDISLPYDENFISFEFAALSYISPERNQYAYKMEGLDKDWVYSGTRRYASYPNLNPGEYVFRVKGSNNDGVWNEAGTSISIIITPPWWKTTWAYILYSILILSIIYFTWKMQVKRIRMSHEYEMSKFEAEKLHEVDEIKSRFFTNISHEFRTPLTLILGPVKQIIDSLKDEKTYLDSRKVRDELKVVHRNANRLLGLVNQLLDISKLESGNMKLQAAPQNIIPLLKALVLSFTSYAERKKITIKFNSIEDEIIAYIDNDKIEKIIINLLSNAFKFTPEGGRVEVTINCQAELVSASSVQHKIPKRVRDDNFVEISISDTGVGIPKEKIPKIFDRFYQVDGSQTREQEGTGIGLSLTKELVELHKGRIEVESEEGKGTTIKIILPLGKQHLKTEEICEEEIERSKEYEKEIIEPSIEEIVDEKERHKIEVDLSEKLELPMLLIVEDNSDVRNYIKSNLNKGYIILEAVDGLDGWNKSIEQIPDLIVSDVMMPKTDGFKLCDKLKTDERTSHIPVILLTAKAALQDKIEGFETGADDYIMKPFEPDELKARVKNLIEQRKRIHEHFKKHGLFEIETKKITPVDQKILKEIFETINQRISDPSLSVETLVENLSLSRSVLHRKVISLLGETPAELIRRIRLTKAAELIKQGFGNLSEISLEVGFSNPAHFSENFKKQFGIPPSQYQQKNTNS